MKVSNYTQSRDVFSRINSSNIQDNESKDLERAKDAIRITSKEKALYPENLTKKDVKKMAKYVNNTHLHYSGNCVLLSSCLHYNIHHRQDILSAKNTASPTVGLDKEIVEQVVFGQELKPSHYFHSIDDVENEILNRHHINGDNSFIIRADSYKVPIFGECEHDFNAVVICESDEAPRVQIIDAWKTSNTLPTLDEMKKHFPPLTSFYIRNYNDKHD
ncbi:T3SS effector cysteine hydrolase SpvD family protein [Edwardsiella ictaluri]|uniref:T3SS effector cysteine hydrolase SpvD family protein n=1 Tax=Edwardsiella ictaluri TaxID=67780 RepID=UPI0018DC52C0|nr:T3SS effector cysteine hydrolase SpvD family protein [Edwardsiella ictaluri]QPW29778.1 T3SS effector cysteine hydrolase SpvD family protein [Edwardsiella ictaluri]WJH20806.1 virulence protein SpvD [Edwardsiella ictaluri]BEH98604.1 hypothetical protein KH20906_13320 [Edwardsiella ictaluri]BEI02099.1 hypothetical protein KB20921_13600 [Edwardsiella ictaluri]BEI05567.1 hypothetical protein KH201010_13530 [Edwardsiella ictaluri]